MDFGALPPEINSARMYAGAGSGPMMSAAAAFNGLAAELGSAASSYESVISTLTSDEWTGPASANMAAAAAPYVTWMNTTAAQLQHAATQATASAAAYEAAFAMTVPPPVIAANRSLLMSLVATNVLGQNTPAIAATEAQYGEMWAQDAAAMFGYAGSSASAGTLTPLTSPAPTTNPTGTAAQAAAVSLAANTSAATGTQTGLSGLISTVQNTVQSLASPLTGSTGLSAAALPSGLSGLLSNGLLESSFNGIADTVAWNMFGAISASTSLAGAAPVAGGAGVLVSGGMGGTVLAGAVAPAGSAGFGGAPALAGLGQASSVGKLSVPASWSAATPASSAAAAPFEGSGWTAATDTEAATTVPAGMPAMATAGRGTSSGPRYGFKPKMVQRPLFAG